VEVSPDFPSFDFCESTHPYRTESIPLIEERYGLNWSTVANQIIRIDFVRGEYLYSHR